MTKEQALPLASKSVCGISPHLGVDLNNLITTKINRSANPTDSIFATPEGLLATYRIHQIATYDITPVNEKGRFVSEMANNLITNPDKLLAFYNGTPTYENQRLLNADQKLKQELIPELNKIASKQETFSLSEKQLLTVFSAKKSLSVSDENRAAGEFSAAADAIWSGFIKGTVHPNLRGLVPEGVKKLIESGQITIKNLQYTQDRIVQLLYTLTSAVLQTHDTQLLTSLHELLTLQTPSLGIRSPQSGMFACAGQSLNDNTLAHYTLIDHTSVLLGSMLNIGDEDGLVTTLTETIRSSPAAIHYILEAQKNLSREKLLHDFYEKRYGSLAESHALDTDSIGEYFTRPLPFPERLYQIPDKLWYLYLEYFSKYSVENKKVNSPILPLSLPDGTVRFIALQEGDNRVAAREVMKYVAEMGNGSEIVDKHVIDTFLTYSKPDLLLSTSLGLRLNNDGKKKTLLTQATHGIPKVGVHIAVDQERHPEIAAKALSFDQSGAFVDVQMGNYAVRLQLNDKYELCYVDGQPLNINEQTKIWWEHVILPPLVDIVCKSPEEHEGFLAGTENMSSSERMEATKHTILKKIGFLRNLGTTESGKEKHHTREQRDRVLSLTYPLPHVPQLDLDELNKMPPYNEYGNKVTYVLPVERELTEAPIFRLPHSYDDSQELLNRDPQIRR